MATAAVQKLTVACLQFNTHHGSDVLTTIKRVDAILSSFLNRRRYSASSSPIDLLVLPELAFTGYAFPSADAILPYTELTARGHTTLWAQQTALRLGCHVVVGYPERHSPSSSTTTVLYNSAVVVSPAGKVLHNYRKHFLYEADERWGASSGPDGFLSFELDRSHSNETTPLQTSPIKVAIGICMDLNPERFESPFGKFEFANFCVEEKVKLILMPMAWLSSNADSLDAEQRQRPEWGTITYWARRLTPISQSLTKLSTSHSGNMTKVAFIAANRSGVEDDRVRYAGSSSVLSFDDNGGLHVLDALSRDAEGVLCVDIAIE
ncbi:carbon-nitrogen hydrolase [Kockiozyma suomiensis]|uniref:carbon-nitrogen hydrolase n=1 Tax=Kockiozyma suomiensis TaxID=1337062 RepID=UPI0033432FE0